MKQLKSAILYKLGRHQLDFEYLFPNVKIVNYVVEDKTKAYNGLACLQLKNLNPKEIKHMVVICDRKNNELTKRFNNLGFTEGKNFIYFEDCGELLNEPQSRKEIKTIEQYQKKHQIDLADHDISNSEMLKKMIYTDSTHSLNCIEPFRTAIIDSEGFVWNCCPGSAEQHIGNIIHKKPEEVWNSTRAKLFRLSIINKTYAFCNLNLCRLCDTDLGKDRLEHLRVSKCPEYTVIAFDKTCNLKCKSCRKCSINFNKDQVREKLCNDMSKKLFSAGWFNNSKQLVMSTQGEVFFSKIYQDILFSNKLYGVKALIIHTNGTLLSPEKLDQLCEQTTNNNTECLTINISVDSIDEETYQDLRPGGNMKILKRNLEYISKARQEWKVDFVSIVVVLQKANYKELPAIAKYMIDLKFDQLDVQTITNWGTYTDEEFEDVCMYDKNGKPKPELVEVLKDPIFNSKDIDFVGNVFRTETYMN